MQIWQNGTFYLISMVNPWISVMYYFLLFMCLKFIQQKVLSALFYAKQFS